MSSSLYPQLFLSLCLFSTVSPPLHNVLPLISFPLFLPPDSTRSAMRIVVRSLLTGSRIQSATTNLAHNRLLWTLHKEPVHLSMNIQREIVFLLCPWPLLTSFRAALGGGLAQHRVHVHPVNVPQHYKLLWTKFIAAITTILA